MHLQHAHHNNLIEEHMLMMYTKWQICLGHTKADSLLLVTKKIGHHIMDLFYLLIQIVFAQKEVVQKLHALDLIWIYMSKVKIRDMNYARLLEIIEMNVLTKKDFKRIEFIF